VSGRRERDLLEEIARLKAELIEARVQAYQDRELLQAKLAREREAVREQLILADAQAEASVSSGSA
jgi:hypothetical protein